MPRIATSHGVRAEHVVAPLSGTAVARLSFDNGVQQVDVSSDPTLTDLVEARFAEPYPVVWVSDNNVHIDYPLGSRLLRRPGGNAIQVNPRVAWSIDVHGGASHLVVDLSDVDLVSVTCHAGLANSTFLLGRPTGTRTIRLSTLKQVRIERPADVPVRLALATGATKVSLDGRFFRSVGGLTDQTSGYLDAIDRYHIVVSGGADTLTIEGA